MSEFAKMASLIVGTAVVAFVLLGSAFVSFFLGFDVLLISVIVLGLVIGLAGMIDAGVRGLRRGTRSRPTP